MNIGDILDGRYEIVASLGAGGMGEVYKATHTLLGTPRVIKIVRPQIAANADARERFFREARVATKVQHPNVATLHDFAALPDGSHYMVWEFIDGENLAQRLRSGGTLPPRAAVRIALQALHGLEAIHRAGIIHRDISPENLMITADGTVKIIDLGVAKLTEADADTVSQTRTGIFVGKLRYAAPEQLGFLPEGETIDGRTDLYALAMVIVELLTGRPPYEAKSPHEYFLHHAREVEQKTVELPANLPGSGALQPVLVKALAPNRVERFTTAHDFAGALEEVDEKLTDAEHTATIAIPLEGDETWRPSHAQRETERTGTPLTPTVPTSVPPPPLPPSTPPPVAETQRTPLPAVESLAPPRQRLNPAMAIVFAGAIVMAGAAFALWPAITHMISPVAPVHPQPRAAQTTTTSTVPSHPAQSAVTVTAVANNLSNPIVTPAANPDATKPTVPRRDQPLPAPPPPNDAAIEERPAPVRSAAVYVDGPGRHGANDRALDRLREELRDVHEVVLLAGGQQVEVYRALHRYIPNLTFGSDSPVVIRFDSTPERLGRDRQHLTASATIVKNGREIFRYDLPSVVDPGAAADAFAQTIAEAFPE